MFQIKIPKDMIGAVYLGDFKFMDTANSDNQVLINRNCEFKITKVTKEKDYNNKDVNVFYMDLLSTNKPGILESQ